MPRTYVCPRCRPEQIRWPTTLPTITCPVCGSMGRPEFDTNEKEEDLYSGPVLAQDKRHSPDWIPQDADDRWVDQSLSADGGNEENG